MNNQNCQAETEGGKEYRFDNLRNLVNVCFKESSYSEQL